MTHLFEEFKNEKSYQYLFKFFPGIIFIIDSEKHTILDVNQKAVDFYGYSHREFSDMAMDRINTYSGDELKLEMSIAKWTKRNYFNVVHKMKDGSLRKMEVRSFPFELEGKTLMFNIMNERVDDQETSIPKNLSQLVNHSDDALCLIDHEHIMDGHILFGNHILSRLFQIKNSDLSGKGLKDFMDRLPWDAHGTEDRTEDVLYCRMLDGSGSLVLTAMPIRLKGVTFSLVKVKALETHVMTSFADKRESLEDDLDLPLEKKGHLIGIEIYATQDHKMDCRDYLGFLKMSLLELVEEDPGISGIQIRESLLLMFTTLPIEVLSNVLDSLVALNEAYLKKLGEKKIFDMRIGVSAYAMEKYILFDTLTFAMNGFMEGQYNQVVYSDYHTGAKKHVLLLRDLTKAMEENELELVCQPIVDVVTSSISGVEMLIRWNHPIYGKIMPGNFIPFAERSSEIVQLDLWVLKHTLKSIDHIKSVGGDIHCHVNISAESLEDDNWKYIKEALGGKDYTDSLVFEITEESNREIFTNTYMELKNEGYDFAIDDFGTGYSSFDRIRKTGARYLKIDKSFMRDLLDKPEERMIIETMITLCSHLGVMAIAEGVETREQLNFLKSKGCQLIQGDYFSGPISIDTFLQKASSIEAAIKERNIGS